MLDNSQPNYYELLVGTGVQLVVLYLSTCIWYGLA